MTSAEIKCKILKVDLLYFSVLVKVLSCETTCVINFFFPSVSQGWFLRYTWISRCVATMFSGFLIFSRNNKVWPGFFRIFKVPIYKSIWHWFYFKISLLERFHFSIFATHSSTISIIQIFETPKHWLWNFKILLWKKLWHCFHNY